MKNLALWAPSASGKTWLLNAFIAALWAYNVSEDGESSLCTYQLTDYEGKIVPMKTPLPDNPTTKSEDQTWFFTRQVRLEGGKISSHTHHLHIRDGSGLAMVDMLGDTWKVMSTYEAILESDIVFILLDHTRLQVENLPPEPDQTNSALEEVRVQVLPSANGESENLNQQDAVLAAKSPSDQKSPVEIVSDGGERAEAQPEAASNGQDASVNSEASENTGPENPDEMDDSAPPETEDPLSSKTSDVQKIQQAALSPSVYTHLIKTLLNALENHPAKPTERFVAVCLTKADLLSTPQADPWTLVRTIFGEQLCAILEEYQQKPGWHLQPFVLSSVGYLDGPGSRPNIEYGTLRDPEHWLPWNVEAPFFWLFDIFERRRLATNGNLFMRLLFHRSRQKHYQPYRLSAHKDEL